VGEEVGSPSSSSEHRMTSHTKLKLFEVVEDVEFEERRSMMVVVSAAESLR
jgi:hypothetical protein